MTEREPVPYTVHMTDTKTGESRTVKAHDLWIFPDKYGSRSLYWYEEGNMACDCNRRGLFLDDDGEGPCGDGRYTVRCVSEDGEVLYTEEEA